MLDLRAAHAAVKRDDFSTAWRLANAALDENPESPEALYLIGCTLRGMGQIGLAHVALSKALAKEQRQPNLWMTYAATLHDLNKWADAEKAFLHVHKMLPDDPMPPANIGATYVQRGLWRDAMNWCDKALRLDPENHIARISMGFACLSLGRWQDAWKHAEALYGNHLQVRFYNPPGQHEPAWDGSPGKTVVVQCDQGVGDIIMFAQCLPRLQAVCKEVVVDCAPRMVGMFKRNFPGVHVYGTMKESEVDWLDNHQIDASTHISYLGRWFLTLDKDFERKAYIKPDPSLLNKWLSWLEKFPKPWLGIAWNGGIQQTQKHLRSVTLKEFASIIECGGSVFDLSYHDSSREVADWNIRNTKQVIRPMIDVDDYDDTIAFVAAMDKVATVTTAVAHVCGSIGRKASVLVPSVAQWRYAYHFNDGKELIWYQKDSLRLYRQIKGENDWSSAINRLAAELK